MEKPLGQIYANELLDFSTLFVAQGLVKQLLCFHEKQFHSREDQCPLCHKVSAIMYKESLLL